MKALMKYTSNGVRTSKVVQGPVW